MQATNSQRILFKKSCQNLHITSFDGFPFHLTTYIFFSCPTRYLVWDWPQISWITWLSMWPMPQIPVGDTLGLRYVSMTTLLTHTVAYSTRPFFRPKTNNQPTKKFLSLGVTWVKVVKMCKILTFKVNFLCQKGSKSF